MMIWAVLSLLTLVEMTSALRGLGYLRPQKGIFRHFSEDNGHDYIYYPSGLNSDLDEDEALQELFLRQISEMHSKEGGEEYNFTEEKGEDNHPDDVFLKLRSLIGTKTLHEEPIELTTGCPLEIAHKGRIAFGNFVQVNTQESKKTRKKREEAIAKGELEAFEAAQNNKVQKSLVVRLSTGEVITVDVGQVISSWDVLADEETPSSPEAWAEVASDALRILSNISPRKSDLQEFWSILSRRSDAIPTDSLDLGIYIYQEHRFGKWINPYQSAEKSNVRALCAAQRYAAALLLHYDDFHFKRRLSEAYVDKETGVQGGNEKSYMIIEGGYLCLDEGMTLFREGEVFRKYFDASLALEQASTSNEKPFRAGCITRHMRALEMYSMAPEKMAPPIIVKHILKKLNKPQSPAGAREVMWALGKSNFEGQTASQGRKSGKNYEEKTFASSITPWTSETVKDSADLISLVTARREMLRKTEVGKTGKKGPSGRMDYRGIRDIHPPICMDGSKTVFLDDAFSLNPETGELLVHIVDVANVLRKFPALEKTAKERLNSIFPSIRPCTYDAASGTRGFKIKHY